jgi:arylsulfatase A-like enzyme
MWMLALALAMSSGGERRAVLIDIDGVRPDTFDEVFLGGALPNFERFLGRDYGRTFRYRRAWTVLPAVTMAAQASLFTGVYPAQHGIPGNQWFDTASGRMTDYMTMAGALCVYGLQTVEMEDCTGGLGNRHLRVPTLFDATSVAGLRSYSVFNQYSNGATWARAPNWIEAFSFVEGDWISYERFDRRMMEHALALLERKGLPDLLSIYFTGVDGAGHERGLAAQADYLREVVDPEIGRLLDHWEALDPNWRETTLFVVVSDHGRTVVDPARQEPGLAQRIQQLTAPWPVTFNGAAAFVYARAQQAEILASDPIVARAAQVVLVRTESGYEAISGELPPGLTTRIDGMNSDRSAEVVVFLKEGLYFALEASSHGGLHESDLRVLLLLAGPPFDAGQSAEPVNTVSVAATIGRWLGFAMPGAAPPLEGSAVCGRHSLGR